MVAHRDVSCLQLTQIQRLAFFHLKDIASLIVFKGHVGAVDRNLLGDNHLDVGGFLPLLLLRILFVVLSAGSQQQCCGKY